MVIIGVCPSFPGSPCIPSIPSFPFVTVKIVVLPSVNVIVYISFNPSLDVFSIDEMPLPISPFINEVLPVSSPSIYQLPFSPMVITGVWPSFPGSP